MKKQQSTEELRLRNPPNRQQTPEGAPFRDQTIRYSPSLERLLGNLTICSTEPENILFLDIETTGLSPYYDDVTLIGWSIGGRVGTIVQGQDIGPFRDAVASAAVMVTFNGIRFDMKFIARDHPDIALPKAHIDLLYACRRLGLKGGQKSIEQQLGIQFRDDVEGVDGAQAVILWHRYIRGDIDALRRLIIYNRADIAAMGAILDVTFGRLQRQSHLFHQGVKFENWSAPTDWSDIHIELPPPDPSLHKHLKFEDLLVPSELASYTIVGIDLTGSEKRASGWCVLEGSEAHTAKVFSDADLLKGTIDAKPTLVSIDSPLCLPTGRISVEDDDPGREQFGIIRECERELKRRGINVYPSLIQSMQKLTARGIRLAGILRSRGIPVIECYPGAAQDIMRVPRKGAGLQWLTQGLLEFGIRSNNDLRDLSHDELDAITAAVVGSFHLASMSEALGTADEPPLIVPTTSRRAIPLVVGISGPIAAGKTTAAQALENRGFRYTRFSRVIDELLIAQGITPTREARQQLGIEVNQTGKQRWLCEMTVESAGSADRIVVDGLRFPDDHACLFERFGLNFFHLHVTASKRVRRARYEQASCDGAFGSACVAPVEARVHELLALSNNVFSNEGSREDLTRYVSSLPVLKNVA